MLPGFEHVRRIDHVYLLFIVAIVTAGEITFSIRSTASRILIGSSAVNIMENSDSLRTCIRFVYDKIARCIDSVL